MNNTLMKIAKNILLFIYILVFYNKNDQYFLMMTECATKKVKQIISYLEKYRII